MSLRDFNSNDDRPISLQNDPQGNGAGLDSFHTVHPEDVEPSATPKIVGAVAVALMIGVAGVALYAHSTSAMQNKPLVTASNLPAAPAPAPMAAAPAPEQQAAVTPDANTPATTPADSKPAPVKTASVARSHTASADTGNAASARMAADTSKSSVQPQQQQAAVIPEPVSPTPSPSDVAANNAQSTTAVPQGATTASDIPATGTAQNNTPAPQQAQSSTALPGSRAPHPGFRHRWRPACAAPVPGSGVSGRCGLFPRPPPAAAWQWLRAGPAPSASPSSVAPPPANPMSRPPSAGRDARAAGSGCARSAGYRRSPAGWRR
jgi:hypothetical protein